MMPSAFDRLRDGWHSTPRSPLFHPEITRLIEIGCTGSVFILFALLKAKTLYLTSGDGGLWFYAAKLWSGGIIPYRDFFMSHPPLQILLPSFFLPITGSNPVLLTALYAILPSGLSGFLIFRIARYEWGFCAGILSAVLFLFGENHLMQSQHFTGVTLALLFLLFGVSAFIHAKMIVAGVFLGIATGTAIYILPAFLVLLLLIFTKSWRDGLLLAKGYALILVPLHLLFLFVAGKAFIEQVYLYHLAKVPGSPYFMSVSSVFGTFFHMERFLILFALFALHAFFLSERRSRAGDRTFILCFLLGLDYLFFLAFLQRSFMHYFLLPLPFLALMAGWGMGHFLWSGSFFFSFPRKWVQGALALSIGFVVSWYLLSSIAAYSRFAPVFIFRRAEEIASYLQNTLGEQETLFGDFGHVPIIALLSDRRIAANEGETSLMRFEGSFSPLSQVLARIEKDHVGALLLRPGRDLEVFPPFKEYVKTYYLLETVFKRADGAEDVQLWRRKRDLPFEGNREK